MKNNPLYISKNCYDSYKRFEYEVLLETNETLLKSNEFIVQKSILNLKKSYLYQDLKFHQETLLNFLYFNDIEFLKTYLHWRYRVYHFRQIDTEYLLYEYQVWRNIILKFVDAHCLHSLTKVYDWMIQNHNTLKIKAISYNIKPLQPLALEIFEASISNDFERLVDISQPHCFDIPSFCEFFSNTISSVTQYVGFSWEVNQLSVAKEHLASQNIEKLAAYFLHNFKTAPKSQNTILVAGVTGEVHSLGLKIAVWILEKLGIQVINFGSSTPSYDLEIACGEFNPSLIILSASLFTNIIQVKNIVSKLQENKNITSKIAISGGAFLTLDQPLKVIQSDYYLKDYTNLLKCLEE